VFTLGGVPAEQQFLNFLFLRQLHKIESHLDYNWLQFSWGKKKRFFGKREVTYL